MSDHPTTRHRTLSDKQLIGKYPEIAASLRAGGTIRGIASEMEVAPAVVFLVRAAMLRKGMKLPPARRMSRADRIRKYPGAVRLLLAGKTYEWVAWREEISIQTVKLIQWSLVAEGEVEARTGSGTWKRKKS